MSMLVRGTDASEVIDRRDGVPDTDDTIFGFRGNDWISGFGGNDFIVGGDGADDIDGGRRTCPHTFVEPVGIDAPLPRGTAAGGRTAGGGTAVGPGGSGDEPER